MPHYASSAPAIDKPHQKLDDFPSVAAISEKVKLNPLAVSFFPMFSGGVTNQDGNQSQDPNGDLGFGQFTVQTETNHSSDQLRSFEGTENLAETRLDVKITPRLTSSSASPADDRMSAMCFDCSPTSSDQHTWSDHDHAELYPRSHNGGRYQTQAMPTFSDLPQMSQNTHLPPGQTNFEYQSQTLHEYQQNAISPHLFSAPTPHIEIPTQTYLYYPLHAYGHSQRTTMQAQGYHPTQAAFLPPGPLPPSYPFPHLTPPDRPLNQQAPHRFPLPYDNTAKATAYLEAFTALYGYSTTSLNSLHALCLTLGHPESEVQRLPKTIRRAQNFLKARYVNIFDLVDYGMRGDVVPAELVFGSVAQLRRYSEDTKKICPASVGRIEGYDQAGNELWRWMLRKWY